MITPSGVPSPVRGTIGQYTSVSAGWTSDRSLAGKTIGFNPGLFTANAQPPGLVNAYTITYPSTPGVYPMTFIAPAIWKNGRADIEVLDNFNFRITLYFFYTTPIEYVSGNIPPGLPFVDSGIYGGGPGSISMYCADGPFTSASFVRTNARGWGTEANLTIDYTSGIKVNVETTIAAESVAYMGIYANNDFSIKGYAQIAPTPGRITGLDADAFITGSSFVRSGGISRASFSIGPQWLNDGVEYTAYIVYKSGNIWYSAKSGSLTTGGGRQAIYGDVSYLLRDNVANYTTGCLSDVPPCKDFSVAVTMDAATYNAALSAAGLSGTQESRFQFVRATLQTSLSGGQSGQNLQVVVSDNALGITALVESFVPSGGVQYIVFGFQYYFDTGVDTILIPVQVSTVEVTELAAPEELCAEEEGNISIPLPVAVGTSYVSQQDGNGDAVSATGVSFSGDNLLIDPTTIPIGVARCYSICSESVTSVVQDCVCECDCIGVSINVVLTNVNGAYAYRAEIDFPISGSDVSYFEIRERGASTQNQSGVTSLTGDGFAPSLGGTYNLYVSGEIGLTNGCVYSIPVQLIQLRDEGGDREDDRSLQICVANCDCEEVPDPEPECDNTISFDSDCSDGVLTFTASSDFNSAVGSDVTECSVDGGTYGACAASYTEGETVTIRRRVSFTDDCPDIEASLTANCEIVNNCENSAELTVVKTDVLLTLTVAGTYGSAVGTEEIYYSLNGGLAYLLYSSPVALDGTENIRAYSVTTFTDGCPDVITPTQSAGGLTVDNTEPLVEYCDGAGEITGFAALIGSGDEIQTIYFDTDMVQTLTVPSGSPCETFTPCATCP